MAKHRILKHLLNFQPKGGRKPGVDQGKTGKKNNDMRARDLEYNLWKD